jgi:Cytochrome P450
MTRPFFTKDRISHFDIFDRHATDALSQLKARLREGHPVDIQDLASRFTMDSASEFLFAKDVESLSAGIPYPHYSPLAASSANPTHPANQFSKAFDEAQRLTAMRSRLGVNWPLAEFWQDRVKQQMGVIDRFIDPILATAVQRKKESGQIGAQTGSMDREVGENESLLDHLVNYTSDEKVLRDETLNILLAGRDTVRSDSHPPKARLTLQLDNKQYHLVHLHALSASRGAFTPASRSFGEGWRNTAPHIRGYERYEVSPRCYQW